MFKYLSRGKGSTKAALVGLISNISPWCLEDVTEMSCSKECAKICFEIYFLDIFKTSKIILMWGTLYGNIIR